MRLSLTSTDAKELEKLWTLPRNDMYRIDHIRTMPIWTSHQATVGGIATLLPILVNRL